MKNKKIIKRIFTIIITFMLLISRFISVDASTSNLEFTNMISEESGTSISDESYSNAIETYLFLIFKFIYIILFFMGIFFIIKKEIKKGIIFIVLSLLFMIPGLLKGLFYVPVTNIK